MLKRLAILGVFVTLASVGLLKGQTAPLGPPKERIAKPHGTQSGRTQPHAEEGKEPSGDTIAAAIVPDKPAASACDETCQQGRQNLAIQRKLEWFTGVLATVGVLQVIALTWQTLFVRRTWAEIHLQAGWMKTQTEHMSRQANLMDQQTGILANSVAASQKSADAAETSARAAMGIAVPLLALQELEFENHGGSYTGLFEYPVFRIVVKNFGQSPAFLKSYAVVLTIDPLPDEPIYPNQPWRVDMHEVVNAGEPYTLSDGRASTNDSPDQPTKDALITRKSTPVVYGFVTYGDVFGYVVHTMKFSKVFFEIDPDGSNALTMDWGGPNYTGQKESPKPN
jgi:hypothetical protein